jgi:uncharacterized protein involved in tolerance to divalent cations
MSREVTELHHFELPQALGIDVDEVERVSLKYTIWFMDGAF